ncbi:hypothetical protein GEMRC1_013597 [Eukaryota sp. GEM-RC1]
MYHSKPPLKTNHTFDGDVVERSESSLNSCIIHLSSTFCFSANPPSTHLHFQQSLLVSILLHLLNHILDSSLEWNYYGGLLKLKTDQLTFLKKVGYVSHRFFDSALLSTKVFLQTNTFHVVPKDLPQLFSFASFFGVDLQSVFLHVDGPFIIEEFLSYSHVISGLELKLRHHDDVEFLNKSSVFFPRLKQLHVCVDSCFIDIPLVELFKEEVYTTVTSINLSDNSIGDVGAIALAEALKVNTSVTSLNLGGNFIGDRGVRALAEMLKVNRKVTNIDLKNNSTGDEGAKALAEALKVNDTITNIHLTNNLIGKEGVSALAEALKVNSTVNLVGVDQLDSLKISKDL